jgi:hypothetical protein
VIRVQCPNCGQEAWHEGGDAGWVRDYCPACSWEQSGVADPARPLRGPVEHYEYAIYWASAAGPTLEELAALRRILPALGMMPLGDLRRNTVGRPCWELGEGRGLDMDRVREAATREGLRLACRVK